MAKVTLKVSKGGGGSKPSVSTNSDFDIRDVLTGLVGSRNVLAPDDKMALYGKLISSLGKDKASKIMDHVYIFNQQPGNQNISIDDRLRRFYDTPAGDPEINKIISKSKSLGYGVIPGFNTSPLLLNQKLAGMVSPTDSTVNPTPNPQIQRRVVLQTRK